MPTPGEILRQYWGYDNFRPRQEEIIQSVLDGKDTLALLPTGGGKSVCFQVPAMCLEGVTIVISPLMALMFDQVNNLKKRNIQAYAVSSAMNTREIDRILDNCVYGDVKFLYVSPERLKNELFLARFKRMKVALIAVDEAHCISQWGYDFRPPYLKIAEIRPLKPEVPILALTASATPIVVTDIQKRLAFKQENLIGTSFARHNLSYNVAKTDDKETKLLEICKAISGTGIVYCATRLQTMEVARFLARNGITAGHYHAGMSSTERDAAYKSWFGNSMRVIAATNAFGMGIDKPDVRFVVHMNVPAQPEAYFQEAGRGGRDGLKAFGVLLYSDDDIDKLSTQLEEKFPPKEFIRQVYKCLWNHFQVAIGAGKDVVYTFKLAEFSKKYELPAVRTMNALQVLDRAGYISLSEAIYTPSKLNFLVNKQELYSYQVANPAMDGFIKIILRSYGGLFEQYVPIREDEIARNAKLDIRAVKEKLKILAQHHILDYQPQNDDPHITLLTGRMNEEQLIFPVEVYEDRKKSETERMNAMIRFIQRSRCRSIQLLEYFGEKNTEACGMCDVCRENKKHGLQPEEYDHIQQAVTDILIVKPSTIEEITATLSQFNKEHVVEYVRWKMDIGELNMDNNLQLVLPGFEES